jgi:hypothetical protein
VWLARSTDLTRTSRKPPKVSAPVLDAIGHSFISALCEN